MKHFILSFLILIISCDHKENIQNQTKSYTQNNDCVLKISTGSADTLIMKNAKQFNKTYGENDSCYILFLDNLVNRSCNIKNQENFLLLDSLYRVSDGYVGEYFADTIGIGLFENCFESTLEYISKNNQTSLLNLLSHSLIYNINIAKKYDRETIFHKLNYYLKKAKNEEHKGIILFLINGVKRS